MSFKSIFSTFTDVRHMGPALEQGIVSAAAHDAHYDIMALGVDRSQSGYYYAGANAMIVQETISQAREEAETIEANVSQRMGNTDLRWSTTSGVAQLADITRHVAMRARFADLVVLPRPYGQDFGVEMEPVVEASLFESQAPVLVIPDNGMPPTQAFKRISVGWNESREALRAVRAALPLLKSADIVRVVVVDPPQHGPNRSDPGGLVSQFLARHDVRVEVDVLSRTMPRISDVLLRHAKDTNADLVVMGAYGHSRFREAILGGATRNMLELADTPVLMAH